MERITNKTAHVMSVLTNKLGIEDLDQAPEQNTNSFAENQQQGNSFYAISTPHPVVNAVEITDHNRDPLSSLILENLIPLDPVQPEKKQQLEAALTGQLQEKEQLENKIQLVEKLQEQLTEKERQEAKKSASKENKTKDPIGTNIVFSHEDIEYICKNIVEEVVVSRTAEIMPKLSNCLCAKCTNDVIALSLNQLPPKYVVTSKGQLIAKLHAYETQHYTNITSAITKSCVLINNKPRHF